MLQACSDNSELKNNESSITKEVQTIKEVPNSLIEQAEEITTFISEPDTTSQLITEELNIENDIFRLELKKYCLNDSALRQDIIIDGELKGTVKPAIQVYHNYQIDINLFNDSDSLVLTKTISKEIFKDSLSDDFFKQSTMFNVYFNNVRSNRIYFDAVLSMPDSDWQKELMFAIFFGTSKKLELDYWEK